MGQNGGVFYIRQLASTVTHQAREQLICTQNYINTELAISQDVSPVVFCNTDSVFVCMNKIKETYRTTLVKTLNTFVKTLVPIAELGDEGLCDNMAILKVKNAYIYSERCSDDTLDLSQLSTNLDEKIKEILIKPQEFLDMIKQYYHISTKNIKFHKIPLLL